MAWAYKKDKRKLYGAALIIAERKRQVEKHPLHKDREKGAAELCRAAAGLLLCPNFPPGTPVWAMKLALDTPSGCKREVIAGALCAAAIDVFHNPSGPYPPREEELTICLRVPKKGNTA